MYLRLKDLLVPVMSEALDLDWCKEEEARNKQLRIGIQRNIWIVIRGYCDR